MNRNAQAFGRSVRYVVLPVEAVRTLNVRTDEEVAEAQKQIDDDMISALEEMVNAARSERLQSREAVLALGAVAW
jgi:hypothetical protein